MALGNFKIGDHVYITENGVETGPYRITGEDVFGWFIFYPERSIIPKCMATDMLRHADSNKPLINGEIWKERKGR